MDILEFLKDNNVILDGGMGTLLQCEGLLPGEFPETWNISKPDVIKNIHKAYFDAGSNIVNTNTFGANLLKFSLCELDGIVKSAVENARAAAEESKGSQPKFVALDIGPTGKLLKPYGDFDFEEAVSVFSETVKLGEKYGADLIFIETMNDLPKILKLILCIHKINNGNSTSTMIVVVWKAMSLCYFFIQYSP